MRVLSRGMLALAAAVSLACLTFYAFSPWRTRAAEHIGKPGEDDEPDSPVQHSLLHTLTTDHLPHDCSACETSMPAFTLKVTLAPRSSRDAEVAFDVEVTWSTDRGEVIDRVVRYQPLHAFVVLSRDLEIPPRHFPNVSRVPDGGRAPFIVFWDKPLSNQTLGWMRNFVFPRDLVTYNVSQYWGLPPGFNMSQKMAAPMTKDLQYLLGYRCMCAFWFRFVWHLPQISNIQYLLRLDTDSQLTGPWLRDPFVECETRQTWLMHNSFIREDKSVVVGLREFAAKYVSLHNITPTNPALYSEVVEQEQPMQYYSNFQLAYVPFFHRPEVVEFAKAVYDTQGIFTGRWGDAPMLTISASIFLPPEHLLARNRSLYPYRHQNYI
eukprot:m51a1_g574 hypothetical protein (379) ;mRNA; r:539411-540637